MAATYDEQFSSEKDKIRILIGDTDVDAALVSDEHILAVLDLEGSAKAAAIYLLDELIARYSHDPTKVERGGMTLDFTKRLETWARLRDRYQADLDKASGASAWTTVPRVLSSEKAVDEYGRA